MSNNDSQWQNAEVANTFLKGVRGAMPGADLQLAVLRRIAQLWAPAARRILDLGCGDGILGRVLLDALPEAQAVFADFSEPMLQAARAALGSHPRAAVVRADFSTPAWREAVAAHAPFDLVVSGYAIHHQPDERKKSLYAEIYGLLSPGGVFLNLEHVSSTSKAGERLFDEFFIDNLQAFHRRADAQKTRQEVADTFYNRPDKKENILAPLDVQCRWLSEIGFEDVDCYFKVFELALFGGRKKSG